MPPADQDCISHNVDNLTVTFINGSFKIVDGSHSLLDFGLNVMDAKRALDIIKYYRMDSHCFVGRPNAPFEYWLAAGAAPSGDMGGEDCISFNPNTIEVKYVSGRWKIVDGSHWMFDFDQNQGNAKKAYDIIKYYGFTKSLLRGQTQREVHLPEEIDAGRGAARPSPASHPAYAFMCGRPTGQKRKDPRVFLSLSGHLKNDSFFGVVLAGRSRIRITAYTTR